ncbi:MAG: hypothetical protein K0U74_16355 [Alphaproteobacteria bacterium]|nr:hypothetical protein [Alphaproteobacteria bacterium]
MAKPKKTLLVEMVLLDDGSWESSAAGRMVETARTPSAANDDVPGAEAEVSTLDTFSRLLSQRNLELLRLIKAKEPQSVAELARLSGRPKASLMLTLRRFHHYGIVLFDCVDGGRKAPRVMCDRLRVDIAI